MRHGEIKEFAQGHTPSEWWNQYRQVVSQMKERLHVDKRDWGMWSGKSALERRVPKLRNKEPLSEISRKKEQEQRLQRGKELGEVTAPPAAVLDPEDGDGTSVS